MAEDPIPQIQDKRPRFRAPFPKNAQTLVLGGISLLMILIILFSGHNAPKPKPTVSAQTSAAVTANQERIQDYRVAIDEQMRKLAAEESELARTKERFPSSATAAAAPSSELGRRSGRFDGSQSVEENWIDNDRRKREYQSLFSSNIALTLRSPSNKTDIGETIPAKTNEGAERTGGVSTNSSSRQGEYRLFEGTILETVLTNRLDSSFSGPVNCLVTTNVYSYDGQKLLIPQGARVLGEVRKLESFGEARLAVMFHRLIMPDGFSVTLDQFKGLDQIGETGLRDQVNHHYLQVFGVSIAIGAFAGLGQANTRYSLDQSAAQAYEQGITGTLSQSALHILDRYLNVLPTFTIREGYRVKVYLSQDLLLPAYDEHPVRDDL